MIEKDVDLILEYVQANLPAALAAVRAQRADKLVTTENPQSYFIYPKARGYKTPAVFVIGEAMDFNQEGFGSNFVPAVSTVNVSVLVEDRNADLLTRKVYRYLSALHEVLEQATLQSSDDEVKIFVRVSRSQISPLYSNSDKESETVFRKEAALYLTVEHRENL